MAFAEDLSPFFSLDEFAVQASARTVFGEVVVFPVIFDQPYTQGLTDLMAASQPQVLAQSAHVVDLDVGCELTIGQACYRVSAPLQPDGTGLTLIVLEQAPA